MCDMAIRGHFYLIYHRDSTLARQHDWNFAPHLGCCYLQSDRSQEQETSNSTCKYVYSVCSELYYNAQFHIF